MEEELSELRKTRDDYLKLQEDCNSKAAYYEEIAESISKLQEDLKGMAEENERLKVENVKLQEKEKAKLDIHSTTLSYSDFSLNWGLGPSTEASSCDALKDLLQADDNQVQSVRFQESATTMMEPLTTEIKTKQEVIHYRQHLGTRKRDCKNEQEIKEIASILCGMIIDECTVNKGLDADYLGRKEIIGTEQTREDIGADDLEGYATLPDNRLQEKSSQTDISEGDNDRHWKLQSKCEEITENSMVKYIKFYRILIWGRRRSQVYIIVRGKNTEKAGRIHDFKNEVLYCNWQYCS